MNKRGVLFLFFFIPLFFLAQNRYWVSGVSANWSSNNWSNSSGGAPDGLGAPTGSETALFNSNGTGNCNVDVAASFNNIRVLTGYTGIIDLNGNSFSLNGASTSRFQAGTINDTPGTSSINLNSSGTIEFMGTNFNASITGNANVINFNGGVFNNIINVDNNSSGSAGGIGGCIFNANVKITNSGTGYFLMGNGSPDVFNGDLELVNTSSSRFRLAYNSVGTQINGNLIVSNTGGGVWFGENGGTSILASTKLISIGVGGFTSGEFRFKNFTQLGTTAQNLSLSGTAVLRFQGGTVFNGNVNFDAPRFYLNGATFNGTSDFEKTGASNDGSIGGNTFVGNAIVRNSGSGYFLLGNGNADVFTNNLTLYNTGSSSMYVGYNSLNNSIGGNLIVTNNPTGSSTVSFANSSTSSLSVVGNVSVYNNGASTTQNLYLANDGDLTIGGNLLIENAMTGTSNASQVYLAGGTNSSAIISGSTSVNNGGANATSRVYLGNGGDVTFNGTLDIVNSASANSSEVYCNYNINSANTYNGNITLTSTNANNDGIYFGSSTGTGVLALTKTITIGVGGFTGRYLYLRNFTQLGNTVQNLSLTGAARLELYNSDWGGNINFSSPAFYTRDSRYRGFVNFTKTGTTNDYSNGGNLFDLDLTLTNNGSGTFSLGNTNSDTFGNDVTINNTGSGRCYIAYNSAGNSISRDLIMTNSGSGSYSSVQVCVGSLSSLTIGRNCNVTNATSAITGDVYIGNNGVSTLIGGNLVVNNVASGTNGNVYLGQNNSFTVNGDLTINNAGTTSNGYVYLGNSASAVVTINGLSSIVNTGAGNNKYVYLGNNGDATFNNDLNITNSSSAINSRVYCNNSATSSNLYNGNISVASTNVNTDGIYFGNGNGVGVLAATKTVTLGIGGFIAGELRFRNFTQTGNTTHSIILDATGTGTFYNYDSDWGGDVTFSGPRFYTRGTRYRRTADLAKTGANSDYSIGGNVFNSNLILTNTGSGYLLIGANVADDFQGNVILNNSGTSHIYIAYSSIGNTISGNLTATNTASGSSGNINISSGSSSELSIGGNVTLLNNGTSNSTTIYLGNSGKISSIGGNLIATNNSSGTSGYIYLASSDTLNLAGNLTINNIGTATNQYTYLANSINSLATIGGTTQVLNSGTGNTSRVYLANQGSAIFNGLVNLSNNSSANNSQIYLNSRSTSNNVFNEHISVESYGTNSDGVLFGSNNGSATLAALKTVTVGANGFITGELSFRNFTQIGATPQTINLLSSGTGIFTNYDSDWGGDIIFSGPRMFTRGTMYRGTSYLEKTAVNSDGSSGGNTFVGVSELKNTGSGYFLMGNGAPDVFQANLIMNNLGTHNMYLGYNSLGNSIGGNLIVNNATTGSGSGNIYISGNSASTLAITGNVNINNTASASNSTIYFGDNGDIDVQGTFSLINNTNSTGNSEVRVASGTNSTVNLIGNVSILNNGSSANNRIYFGTNGDVNVQGTFSIINNTNSTGSGEVRVASGTNSTVNLAGNVSILNNGNSTYNRIYFYNSGNGTIHGAVTINNAPTGINGRVYMGNGSTSYATFNSTVDIVNAGANNSRQVYVGSQGDLTFNGNISLSNTATANSSLCYFNQSSNSNNLYNGNITLESYGTNCDGIQFGVSGGLGTLATSKIVSLGANGFTDGQLYFRNFTQLGNTPQAITTTNNSRFENYASTWNGNVSFVSPRVHTRQTTYNGVAYLEKTGAGNDASFGANTYNNNVTFKNSGTGYFMPTNNNASDHNGNVTYIKSSTGLIYPTYSATSTYAGNINIDANAVINFAGNSGRVLMDGTSAQSINNIGGAFEPNFRRLRTNNLSNEITLNTPINIQIELDLIAGNIISNATNFITMRNNATVASVSNNAYVNGPLLKKGNDAFIFPVGKIGVYRPIEISAPSSTVAQFKAEFFPTDPKLSGYNDALKDPTLNHISNCEYWILNRLFTANPVNVKLYYDSYGSFSCSGVDNQTELAVARWDGTMWKDHGNGGFGGTVGNGWVTTSGVVTSFSPFTLASTTINNPLPIELVSFSAIESNDVVDLFWETASEIENDYFTIERSRDGVNYVGIEKINGAGNSTQNIEYTTIDKNPLSGISYYRLKQTDFNGEFTYSDIEVVHFSKTNGIVIYPNPVKDILTIEGLKVDDHISIYAIDGKLIYNGKSTKIDVATFSYGIYQLVISHANGTQENLKFIK